MMTALLLYGYSRGVRSSRKIETACEERVDFMAVTGRPAPDHRTISDFRKRRLDAMKGRFKQVLALCAKAGLVSLGHVVLDGTKIKANASKHKLKRREEIREAMAALEAEAQADGGTGDRQREGASIPRVPVARFGEGRGPSAWRAPDTSSSS